MNHPYIPNSSPEVQARMLADIGANSVDELFDCIPDELRFKGRLDIPEAMPAEASLLRHFSRIAAKNRPASGEISFLGGGCYDCYVPAACEEINARSEFLTAYAGDPYEDHGRFQALFEYESLMAELLEMDVVNVPTYDGAQAAATALRMACRATGRARVLVPANMAPDRLKVIRTYLHPHYSVDTFGCTATLAADTADLAAKLDGGTAAVLIEQPNFLGVIETSCAEIARAAHERGAMLVALVDPSSLGALASPASYGADIACGDVQPLGVRMFYGGGRGGFIASADDPKIVAEYPSRLFGIALTSHGEWGFGDVAWERTSFAGRENAKEFVGTAAALWGITAAVYIASMGPRGMAELGTGLMKRARYLAGALASVPGVRIPSPGPFFREFPVTFERRTVREVNDALLARGIFGGHDLEPDFPSMPNTALYAVSDTMTKADMDALVSALREILG